jgi:hypothetical protein
MRWIRAIGGALLTLVGLIWILQGVNVMHGSGMTGRVKPSRLHPGVRVAASGTVPWPRILVCVG